MSRKFIPVEEAFDKWRKDSQFVAEYDALHAELATAVKPKNHNFLSLSK
jgi:hypothetical protein